VAWVIATILFEIRVSPLFECSACFDYWNGKGVKRSFFELVEKPVVPPKTIDP